MVNLWWVAVRQAVVVTFAIGVIGFTYWVGLPDVARVLWLSGLLVFVALYVRSGALAPISLQRRHFGSLRDAKTIMKPYYFLGTSILLMTALSGCSADQKEVGRQISPDQKLVAILTESMAGGSVREDIYLNDQGIPLNLDKPVFSGIGCDHLSFDWANDYTLQIHYETTCAISHFTNRWFRPSDLAVGRPVPIEIILMRN